MDRSEVIFGFVRAESVREKKVGTLVKIEPLIFSLPWLRVARKEEKIRIRIAILTHNKFTKLNYLTSLSP